MADGLQVLLTFAIVYLGWLTWRTNQRIEKLYEKLNWFTGAMESHSETMLLIEAKRGIGGEPIRTVWCDPTVPDKETIEAASKRKHGEDRKLDVIRFHIPKSNRVGTQNVISS